MDITHETTIYITVEIQHKGHITVIRRLMPADVWQAMHTDMKGFAAAAIVDVALEAAKEN